MRKVTINLKALPQQRDLIVRAARLTGKSCSEFVLEAAHTEAQSLLLDQVFFHLDGAKFQEFTAMLEGPQQPNAGLERLLAVKVAWEAGA